MAIQIPPFVLTSDGSLTVESPRTLTGVLSSRTSSAEYEVDLNDKPFIFLQALGAGIEMDSVFVPLNIILKSGDILAVGGGSAVFYFA